MSAAAAAAVSSHPPQQKKSTFLRLLLSSRSDWKIRSEGNRTKKPEPLLGLLPSSWTKASEE